MMDAAGNPWALRVGDDDSAFLVYESEGYEIPLAECRTSAEVLDWIIQIVGKNWANDSVIAGLVHAFDAILRPQQVMCSFGKEGGPIDVETQVESYVGSYTPFREVDFTAPVTPTVRVIKEKTPTR